jgi:hypothetical protein
MGGIGGGAAGSLLASPSDCAQAKLQVIATMTSMDLIVFFIIFPPLAVHW